MPYTTVSDVQALVGDVVKNRTFSSSTKPTESEVNLWIDQIQSEVQLRLYSYGFISRDEEIQSTDLSYGWIKRLASVGASARVLQSLPAQVLLPDSEEIAQNRAVNFDSEYHRGLTKIQRREILVTDKSASYQRLRSGFADDCDKPFFYRHQFDHPELRHGYYDSYGNFEYYSGVACSCCPSDSADDTDTDDSGNGNGNGGTPAETTYDIAVGWSNDESISSAEFTETSETKSVTIPDRASHGYLLFWHATADGTLHALHIGSGGFNELTTFTDPMDLSLSGTAGKAYRSINQT